MTSRPAARGRAVAGSVCGLVTLAEPKPIKTVGSFWPYAPTLLDYVRRAMPMDAPQSLSDDAVYAVSAYLLFLNGLVPVAANLDAGTMAAVRMPNRDGFVPDPRPDIHGRRFVHEHVRFSLSMPLTLTGCHRPDCVTPNLCRARNRPFGFVLK